MKRFLALFLILAFIQPVFAFKKKEKAEPMVQTVEEWMEAAEDIRIDNRELKLPEKEDEKFIPPEKLPLQLEKYNVKPGSKELDLSKIYKTHSVRSPLVSDSSFKNAVFTESYYYPQTRQIASTFYLIQLDDWLFGKESLESTNIFQHTRYPLISTALPSLKENLFSTLTLVDFSKSGNEILVKEKTGSTKFGLYETHVWLYFLTDEPKENNDCYMNNLSFSKTMNDFESSYKSGASSDLSYVAEEKEYNYDLENLKEAPNDITPQNLSGKAHSLEEVISEKNPSAPVKKLTYNDISNYITGVWEENPEVKIRERWYKTPPKEYNVSNFSNEQENLGFAVRLNLLNESIKAYWLDRCDLVLNHIRWDLNPLGFSSKGNEIIVKAYAYSLLGEKISLGIWAVDVKTGLPRLITDDEPVKIQSHGVYLVEKLNSR